MWRIERTFKENFAPILKNHEVQFFAHFWNQDLEKLSKFTDICNPILELENKISYTEVKNYFNMVKDISNSLPNQAYGAYKVYLMLDKYIKENNTFDLYIKMRSDLAFLNPVNFNFDLNSVYVKDIVHWRPLNTYINDYIYFTKNYDAVKKMAELGFNLNNIMKEHFVHEKDISKNIYCPEEILAKHFVNKKIITKTYNFNIDLARYHD